MTQRLSEQIYGGQSMTIAGKSSPSSSVPALQGSCSTTPSFQSPPDWQEILTYFRGSELQNYFTRVLEDNLKVFGKSCQGRVISWYGCV